MRGRAKNTFPLFELALVVALVFIGWAFSLHQIVPEADENRKQLTQFCGNYRRSADYVRSSINELHDALNGFLQSTTKLQREQFKSDFEAKTKQWRQWVKDENQLWNETQTQSSGSDPIKGNRAEPGTKQAIRIQHRVVALCDVADMTYTNYLWKAQYLMTNLGKPSYDDLRVFYGQSAERDRSHLLDLAEEASIAARDMELVLSESALSSSQSRFRRLETRFKRFLTALAFGVIAMCFVLMLGIYRRKQGQASRVVGEQQRQHLELQAAIDKLTNFGQLAQELAHEIKHPLIAISARLYTLQKRLASDSEAHKDVAVIGSEIARLGQIVKDFRLQAQPNEPKLADLTVEEALGQVRDLMALPLEQKRIKFKFEVEGAVVLRADPLQLKQVIINLLSNAAESLQDSGTVTLRARKGTRALRGKSTEVAIIEVEDTGSGIRPEIQPKIFDPFFSTKKMGTGLGLGR